MLQPGGVKIWRPRQLYMGSGERDYVDISERKDAKDSTLFDAPVEVSHGGDSRRNRLATYKDAAGIEYKPKL
jgi:citrate synthase